MIKPKSRAALMLATFFGLGYLPGIPGTLGAAATVLLYYLYVRYYGKPSQLALAALIVILLLSGARVAALASQALDDLDPKPVIIDEVIGQLIAVLFAPVSTAYLVVAFILFRVFDVFKPFPARQMERLHGGWGIMLDDVVAGIYANICLHLGALIFDFNDGLRL